MIIRGTFVTIRVKKKDCCEICCNFELRSRSALPLATEGTQEDTHARKKTRKSWFFAR
jgi:hypothetical protein